MERSRDDILASARGVESSVWQRHVHEFVDAFVTKERRERWMFLLLKRTEKTRRTSHKLHTDLDRTKCTDLKFPWKINPANEGIYDDFSGEPKYMTFEDSMIAAPMYDGLFSIVPGKLALFFFHEGEILLCESLA